MTVTGAITDNAEAMDVATESDVMDETSENDVTIGIETIMIGAINETGVTAEITIIVTDEGAKKVEKDEGIKEAMIQDDFTSEEEDPTKDGERTEEEAATPQRLRGVAKAKEELDRRQGPCRVRGDSGRRTDAHAASHASHAVQLAGPAEPAEPAAGKATEMR